jgi:hypothetical protein
MIRSSSSSSHRLSSVVVPQSQSFISLRLFVVYKRFGWPIDLEATLRSLIPDVVPLGRRDLSSARNPLPSPTVCHLHTDDPHVYREEQSSLSSRGWSGTPVPPLGRSMLPKRGLQGPVPHDQALEIVSGGGRYWLPFIPSSRLIRSFIDAKGEEGRDYVR